MEKKDSVSVNVDEAMKELLQRHTNVTGTAIVKETKIIKHTFSDEETCLKACKAAIEAKNSLR